MTRFQAPSAAATSRRARAAVTAAKLCAVAAVGALLCWNVTLLSRLSTRTASDGARLRAQAAAERQSVDEGGSLPWFLQPEAYEKESGCDFSSAVGLFKPEELDINCGNIDELLLGEFIGAGFWREVYKASWKGRDIAVKLVKKSLLDRPDIIPRHVEESAAIFPIRNDPNIVALVGWCETTVIVEYIPQQLDTLLFESEEPISVRRSMELARDAARGVAQLHGAPGGPFAHADLQARQFLIDANGTLKLNDFNRVKFTGPQRFQGKKTGEKCTFQTSVAKGKWRAPEEYTHRNLDEKLDVYSLSLVLWAMRSRVKPYREYTREEVYEKVPRGLRPSVDAMSEYPAAMQDLIVRAWSADPTERPSASEMAQEIDRILASYVPE